MQHGDDGYDFKAALKQICADPATRRELLFLRALEKEDEATLRDLESVQPGLRAHVERLVADQAVRNRRLAGGRELLGELYEERLEYHTKRLVPQR
jgi:hypothetical protein